MKETRTLMGMPVTLQVDDEIVTSTDLEDIFTYLQYIDDTFSTYKESSEISRINRGELSPKDWSPDMQFVMDECERTNRETNGYFNIDNQGILDPSGYVKGWAIQEAAQKLHDKGFSNFFVDIAGDAQTAGRHEGKPWAVGIRNPFNRTEIVKQLTLSGEGIATSGTAVRGQHIYNPHAPGELLKEVVSLTVIAPKVVDADRVATAAFAMGPEGIKFIATQPGLEGYAIDKDGLATFTPGFNRFVL